MAIPRVLVLCPSQWEEPWLREQEQLGALRIQRVAVAPFSLPRLLGWPHYDPRRHAQRLIARYRGVDAVWSSDDMLGTLLAAVVARELGLPGNAPEAVVQAQHKVLFRQALLATGCVPTTPQAMLPGGIDAARVPSVGELEQAVANAGLSWPVFVKPAKGTYSSLARRVASAAELRAHLQLPWLDRRLLRASVDVFHRLASEVARLPCASGSLLAEPPIAARQANVDGLVCGGRATALGVIDEWMHPDVIAGAKHFAGFQLPSLLPDAVQTALCAAACAAAERLGLRQGLFNAEFFVHADGTHSLIELNPRAAGQFADLYERVCGVNLLRLGMDLALGRAPDRAAYPVRSGTAASVVFRSFRGACPPRPHKAARAWLRANYPTAQFWEKNAGPIVRALEYRWLGSHRYGVVNLHAADRQQLCHAAEQISQYLYGVPLPQWSA